MFAALAAPARLQAIEKTRFARWHKLGTGAGGASGCREGNETANG